MIAFGFPWPVRVTLLWNKNNAVHSLPDGNEGSVYLYWECARIVSFKKKISGTTTKYSVPYFRVLEVSLTNWRRFDPFCSTSLTPLYFIFYLFSLFFCDTSAGVINHAMLGDTEQLKAVYGLKRSTAFTILRTPGLPWGKPCSALRMHTVNYLSLSGVAMTEVCKSSCLSSHSGSITRALSSAC